MQMRIQQTGEVAEILCVCFDFHTSNIQRAQMKRNAVFIVRSGSPILRSPEGRSDYGQGNDNTHNVTTCFSARKRYFRFLRLFFAYFFLARQKKVCPRSDSYSVTVKTEPPVNPEKSLPHPLDAVPSAPPARHYALRA